MLSDGWWGAFSAFKRHKDLPGSLVCGFAQYAETCGTLPCKNPSAFMLLQILVHKYATENRDGIILLLSSWQGLGNLSLSKLV